MNELEDKKLAEHIRTVFEDFEDEGATVGWQELRRSYPSRKRRPLILWFSSAAAVMVLVSGLWIWRGGGSDLMEAVKPEFSRSDKPSNLQNLSKVGEAVNSGSTESRTADSNPERINSHVPVRKTEVTAENRPLEAIKTPLIPNYDSSEPGGIIAQTDPETRVTESLESERPELQRKLDLSQPAIAEMSSTSRLNEAIVSVPTNTEKEITVTAYGQQRFSVQNQNPGLTEDIIEASQKSKAALDKKVSFAIVGGSYFNFAEGSEASLNFSAGLASDIRLTRNLKLSTGLTLATNNLYFEHGVPSTQNLDYFSAPLYSSNPGSNFVNVAAEYSAQLLNLDIPLNLKYITGKSGFFISGGLSSGLYLSENYTMAYKTFDLSNSSNQAVESADKVRETFSGVDFAKTLNFSFGRNFVFGKKQTISIEPFVKYPLQGLGAQDLRFGASGIHLRLNFNSAKP